MDGLLAVQPVAAADDGFRFGEDVERTMAGGDLGRGGADGQVCGRDAEVEQVDPPAAVEVGGRLAGEQAGQVGATVPHGPALGFGRANLVRGDGRGGVQRAVADGSAAVIVSPDVSGGRVRAFAVRAGALVRVVNFFGIDDAAFRGGARVAAADVNGDGRADLIVGAGFGGGPRVFVLSGATVLASGATAAQASPVGNFFVAGDTTSRGGVRVAVADADGRADVLTGSGDGPPARVRVYAGRLFPAAGEPTASDLAPFGGAVIADGVYVG